jgi:hypothetical protein
MRYAHLILFLLGTNVLVHATDLDKVRASFYKASFQQEICESIYNEIKDKDYQKEPIMLAYQGVYQAIMAQYVWNPFTKWWYFKTGVESLEEAIVEEKENIELIFLRFSIQTNCPSFLGYNENIIEDKTFIMKGLLDSSIRTQYQPFVGDIINYLMATDQLTAEEKKSLAALCTEC